ncbi:MAG TPA: hypothetical protein VMZ29_00070, partial [Candidatus Bathyarchaeia archaeon]|nr:hypothetical protein [Candidatus Bathyarchaeia archaeon]
IDGLIDHSRAIIKYKTFLEHQRRHRAMLSMLPDKLPSQDNLKDNLNNIEQEIHNRIEERHAVCKRFLTAAIDTKKYGYTNEFYLSTSELRDGYVPLTATTSLKPESEVLFLKDHTPYQKGKIYPFEQVKDILLEVKTVLKPGDLTFHTLTYNKTYLL